MDSTNKGTTKKVGFANNNVMDDLDELDDFDPKTMSEMEKTAMAAGALYKEVKQHKKQEKKLQNEAEKDFHGLNNKKDVTKENEDDSDDDEFKKTGIKAPDLNDPDFELQATKGLEDHWNAWKNSNGYRFKEEKFDDLQMKQGFAGEFEDDDE